MATVTGSENAPGDVRGAIAFRVLGPIEVVRDGADLTLGGPRQRALLALLLMERGRPVSGDRLVDELWHGEPPEGATTTLRSYVSRLRSVLGDDAPIRGSAAGYALAVDQARVDSYEFERLTREAEEAQARRASRRAADRLTEALSLWRGRPFGELAVDGRLRIEADRLEELRLHAIEERAEAELALGLSAGLVGQLEALVEEHPYRERLWRQLMLALYRTGRQADALATYHRARRLLDEHLGLEPGPELQRLEQQILRQEVSDVVPVEQRHNLPAQLTSFVGREAELQEIRRLLSEQRLVTLTGVGGVGKTRLALEVATRSLADFADGITFTDLAPVAEPAIVARQIAHTLEIREQAETTASEQIRARLRRAEQLLLLDNCEHVRESSAELAQFILSACPDVRILATSRIALGAPGEIDYHIAPLAPPPTSATAEDLRANESVELLVARARAARPRLADDDAALEQAARICRDLDGLPLAIELAAARAKALSLDEIASRLDDRFRFLVSWRRLSAARHQTLKQAMDWSYELLSAEEQSLLARLSVFAGGFSLAAVAGVCVEDERSALESLEGLVAASLVLADEADGTMRYRLLHTVRQYAAGLLRPSEAAELARRHADYFATLAARAEPELTGHDQAAWFATLDAEHDNLRLALRAYDEATDPERMLRFTVALTRFWYVRGYLAEARQWLVRALAQSDSLPVPLRRRGITAAAAVALLQGDYEASISLAERSLEVAREADDSRLVANGLSNLGAIVLAAGDLTRARALLEEAVALARTVGDERILALALNNLADHALTAGDYGRAEPLFRESLALLRSRGDTSNVARSLFNLGAVALRENRLDEADELFRQSLARSREAGDKEDLAWGLLGLAALAAARDDGQRAPLLLGAAAALLDEMGAAFKPFERQLHDETEARTRALVGDERFAAARSAGAAMSLNDALEVASEPPG